MTKREIERTLKQMSPGQLEHFKEQLELKTLSYQLLERKPARPELLDYVKRRISA